MGAALCSDSVVAEHAFDPGPLSERLATGMAKLGLALKHELRAQAGSRGLSPTQAQLVVALSSRPRRVGELAAELGVGVATVSEALSAIESKGLVERRPDPSDRRAYEIRLTAAGSEAAAELAGWPDFLAAAIETLDPSRQEALLAVTIELIRRLQDEGRIPLARMCVTCAYFRPDAHPDDPARPHHCAFVDAPFGPVELRVDCADYVAAGAD